MARPVSLRGISRAIADAQRVVTLAVAANESEQVKAAITAVVLQELLEFDYRDDL